jgi:hypothetical protein
MSAAPASASSRAPQDGQAPSGRLPSHGSPSSRPAPKRPGAPGVVVSAEEILERVWDEAADPFSQAVRTTMSRLRAKLGDPPVIETVTKFGYRIAG